jgi:protein TonB
MATLTYIRQLEEKRGLFFQIGLTLALMITWLALQLSFTYTIPDLKVPETETEQIIFEIQAIKDKPESKPVTAKPIAKKQPVAATVVTTTAPVVIDKPVEIFTPEPAVQVTAITSANSSSREFLPPIFPEFEGGIESLYLFLKTNLRYDKKAVRAGLAGTVYVNFKVDEKGNISDIKVSRGVHPLLDQEAVRVVSIMPAWKPGRNYDGSPVTCNFNLPIRFTLK